MRKASRPVLGPAIRNDSFQSCRLKKITTLTSTKSNFNGVQPLTSGVNAWAREKELIYAS
jgi:hypothetical protein